MIDKHDSKPRKLKIKEKFCNQLLIDMIYNE